jgi:hypothetical protein
MVTMVDTTMCSDGTSKQKCNCRRAHIMKGVKTKVCTESSDRRVLKGMKAPPRQHPVLFYIFWLSGSAEALAGDKCKRAK